LTDATSYRLTVAMRKPVPGKQVFDDMQGALFTLDPRPNHWSTGTTIIPTWRKSTWTFVDVPMLYPMGKNLPKVSTGGQKPSDSSYYDSVYEERFQAEGHLGDFRLEISVQPLDVGMAALQFIGTAGGVGVQITAEQFVNLAKQSFDAFMTGADWYDKAEKVASVAATTAGVVAIAGLGSTGWGAVLVAVGAMIYLLDKAFSGNPEPLRMAIELAITGKVAGSVITAKQMANHYIYLPGRFSFPSVFHRHPLQSKYVDNFMPRYDRTLGLFGFRYDPSELKLPMGQQWYVSPGGNWAKCIFPSVPYDGNTDLDLYDNPLQRHLTRVIDRWLPVIYNPYAEIVPARPELVAPDDNLREALAKYTLGPNHPLPSNQSIQVCHLFEEEKILDHEDWFAWIQDVSPKRHLAPEPDDKNFPTGEAKKPGSRMYVIANTAIKSALLEYAVFHTRPLHDTELGIVAWSIDRRPLHQPRDVPNGVRCEVVPIKCRDLGWIYPFTSFVPFGKTYDGHSYVFDPCMQANEQIPIVPTTYRTFEDISSSLVHQGWRFFFKQEPNDGFAWNFDDGDNPFPITDVLFCWDIKYFYYGRTRKEKGKVVFAERQASFRVPVGIDVLWKFKSYWNVKDEVPDTDMKYVQTVYKSAMLHDQGS
jgi:hypothetical protein